MEIMKKAFMLKIFNETEIDRRIDEVLSVLCVPFIYDYSTSPIDSLLSKPCALLRSDYGTKTRKGVREVIKRILFERGGVTMSNKRIILIKRINEFWRKACVHDKIPVDSIFVIFSKNNPFIGEYENLMVQYRVEDKRESIPIL